MKFPDYLNLLFKAPDYFIHLGKNFSKTYF